MTYDPDAGYASKFEFSAAPRSHVPKTNMKLFSVTITGISDDCNLTELFDLSEKYPFLEWGVLFSETKSGNHPRYPSSEWLKSMFDEINNRVRAEQKLPRLAGHLCGKTMRKFMDYRNLGIDAWLTPMYSYMHPYTHIFARTQVNFNAKREKFTPQNMGDLSEFYGMDESASFITQQNEANSWVWETIQQDAYRGLTNWNHHILHDASGGNGTPIGEIPTPISGMLNGYAGGINPANVFSVLDKIESKIQHGYTWIDMESGVRDENDHLNLPAIKKMLHELATVGEERNWF
jgi:hypothetical protein